MEVHHPLPRTGGQLQSNSNAGFPAGLQTLIPIGGMALQCWLPRFPSNCSTTGVVFVMDVGGGPVDFGAFGGFISDL